MPEAPASLRFPGTIISVTNKSLLGVAETIDQQLPESVMTLMDGQQRLSALNLPRRDTVVARRGGVIERLGVRCANVEAAIAVAGDGRS